jgi:hypothetical protein
LNVSPEISVDEGDPTEAVNALLIANPMISALVLGAGDSPSQLVRHFTEAVGQLPCPLMIVPSTLSTDALDRVS